MALRKKLFKILICCYLLLSGYLFGVAMFIEYLNYKAGGILPNREYRNNDPAQGPVRWRVAITGNLKGLGMASENDANGISSAIPDKDELERDRLALANNRLLRAVITLGLPQYPLLFLSGIAFVLCLVFRPQQNLKIVICTLSVSLLLSSISFVCLLFRDYFGSLGW